jgi:uncharacterized protein (TIGR02246 family)
MSSNAVERDEPAQALRQSSQREVLMQNRKKILTALVGLSCIAAGCTKKEATTAADSIGVAGAVLAMHDADALAIVAADSSWLRNVVAKNVDSLMTWYTPDAVSFGFGTTAKGTEQIRALYTEMTKSTITNPKLVSSQVEFSNDGTMAYDYGTYEMTMAAPGKKPVTGAGSFLNVWRKEDGQWKLVAEMSTPAPSPKT